MLVTSITSLETLDSTKNVFQSLIDLQCFIKPVKSVSGDGEISISSFVSIRCLYLFSV